MFLIVGTDSEIGSATARFACSMGEDVLTTTRRAPRGENQVQLDFSGPVEDFEIPEGIKYACIFVAIARLAACATDPEGSAWINVHQTVALVDRLVQRGIYTLFLSSNQVFNGNEPLVPFDAPLCPISEYGHQKARAEQLLHARIAAGAPIGILRLAKVISPGMKLAADWKTALTAGRPIQAFTDMTLAPVPVELVAQSIVHLLKDRSPVIAQLSGPRDINYWELGCLLASSVGTSSELVKQTSTVAAGLPKGSSPRYTTMDSSLIANRYGLVVPDILSLVGDM